MLRLVVKLVFMTLDWHEKGKSLWDYAYEGQDASYRCVGNDKIYFLHDFEIAFQGDCGNLVGILLSLNIAIEKIKLRLHIWNF